ncbi:MAG TPA: hypothetical protein DCM07_33255, partial [Planctomycetaceae bacterium]|nr:hypothetical protein [Planctomycetaceae bacterium]
FLIILFVPMTESSDLKTGDIMNPHGLATTFLERVEEKQEFETKIYEGLTSGDREYLKAAAADPNIEPGTAVESDFVTNLNSILQEQQLYDPADFEGLTLNQQAEQLLKVSPGELNVEQRSRLNRLLFEARYSADVRKVQGKGWRKMMMTYGL